MLQFLVSCLLMVCSEPAGEESPRDWWIGYSESRNDLPEGQFANWITRRAYVVRADGSQRRSIGAELASQEHSWTQFAGWSPDGRHAIVYSSWEDPANAQWEREHKTFRMTEGWLVDSCLVDINNGSIQKRGAMEPHVEETGDGRVLMVMRNQLGKLYFSESSDEGATWSEPWASELITPESCPELTRIPGTGDLLLIWNHHYDASFRSHFGKRSPLTSAISKDHGKSWQSLRDIETDPSRAFSNPACRFTRDGKAIVNYWTCEYLPDWRMQDVIDLRVAVIDTAWFYGGKSSR